MRQDYDQFTAIGAEIVAIGPDGPNADAAIMTSIFWIEEVEEEGGSFLQLQYTQTVTLNFAGLSWPHVSLATLRQVAPGGGGGRSKPEPGYVRPGVGPRPAR